ncbi:N-methyl-L-tryptophan oxidase [Hyphococcus flavus]|uniref:N-methyl-L-tryptophan oxidase n=1 Tax=Hyphococcus flavus TaxID=1866326 RepID=A0AAE9ZB88_9PROT|nr:N-methyl-L-tryptophan oxidase [Hyphococcus flavus]WDI31373.1 N-methyl-L-tryptophan oxidase [Hyphococcus flavus]
MAAKLKCAVIGAGAIGSATAYALSRQGADVCLYEQFDFFHHRGSSHGPTRLFRTAYFEHTDYVPLLKRSATLWRDLEFQSGQTLYCQTGVMMAGRPDSPLMAGIDLAARQHSLDLPTFTASEARTRFPVFSFDDDMIIRVEKDAGFVCADRAIAAFLTLAKHHGAQLLERHPVLSWREENSRIVIKANDETHAYDRLIIAPGAYAFNLLKDIGAAVTPVRKSLFWTAPDDNRFHTDSGFLPFAIQQPDGRFYYGFPAIDEDGVKVGEHTGGMPVNTPADDPEELRVKDRKEVSEFLEQYAPALKSDLTNEQSCLYEMSPDGHFIIDTHPECPQVSFAAGLSGHGFKFAPVIGEALADLALQGVTQAEFDFLKLSRFRQ